MFDRERRETLGTKLEAEMTFVVPLPEKVVDDCWKELWILSAVFRRSVLHLQGITVYIQPFELFSAFLWLVLGFTGFFLFSRFFSSCSGVPALLLV